MQRREFLSDISLGIVAACAGCLASCAKDSGSNPFPGTTPPTGINFTVDLSTELLNVGNSTIKQGVIIVRLAASNDPSSFTAVQANCTHEGTVIGFNNGQGIFICPNHGSQFSTSGTVVMGPATRNLKKYNIAIDATTMTVTA